jgi:hypothetical protein
MNNTIKITSGCDGHLIGYFNDYTIEDGETKHGIKCKWYHIPEGENCWAGYNDFHCEIEFVFKCDGCGDYKPIKEKFKVYDENYKLQKGLYECAKCKGL